MCFKNNKNNSKLTKFYQNVLFSFKIKMNCFALFSNRMIEGNAYHLKNSSSVDIGFKYLVFLEKPLSSNIIPLKVLKLEGILNDIHCDYMKFKNDLAFKLNWSLIKKSFINKCILRGRILNPIYNGFSVGIWGFVGFVPKRYSIVDKCNLRSVFVVMRIDHFKNTFILSQKKIEKKSSRVLYRLSSQLAYISKN